jgi:hypothetical protein
VAAILPPEGISYHLTLDGLLAATIAGFIQRENQSAKPIQWTYTVEKLALKLGID